MHPRLARRLLAPLATAALLAASLPALAVQAFTASYQANALGMRGEGRMQLAQHPQDGGRWRYSLNVRSQMFELSQQTDFDLQGSWLRPLSSTDTSRKLVKRETINTSYDWNKHQARWSGDVKPERAGPAILQEGDMDALLLNLAIVRDIAAGRAPSYRLVENGSVRPQTYTLAGKESLTIGDKTWQTTKAIRDTGKRQTIVWVAEGMPVPVRILQRENGMDTIDLKITSLE